MVSLAPGLKKRKTKVLKLFLPFTFYLLPFTFILVGCGPTYPKERVDGCVVELCKKEYGVDVEVKIVGKTIGIYIPIDELIDRKLAINAEAIRKVDDVIMSVSRVALSTDADFNFYVLVAQDPAIPDLELVIIRYVTDIKRFLVTDISRNEYLDRMITELKLTPQAQREKLIRELFKRIGVEVSDKVIEDYFKSGYIETISDIGYWNGKFFLKDIAMGEFLAKQIEERIRKDFSREDSLRSLKLNLAKGSYQDGIFDFEMEIDSRGAPPENTASNRTLVLKRVYGIFSKVLYGYKFENYSYINLSYSGERIIITKEDLDSIRKRKVKPEDII